MHECLLRWAALQHRDRSSKGGSGAGSENLHKGVGFSDAGRGVCVTRNIAWRRRSVQAGNRGVGLGGSFVAMGI
jgi:hypothetical protein